MINILLLEDNEVLSETLIELLNYEGFEVIHVSNGESAINATFDKKFDLLLLDINVPLLSGFDFLKLLRESSDKTPAIFITALTDVASLSKAFDIGADDYIKKPFDFDELLIRIQALLRKSYRSYENAIRVNSFRFVIEKDELYKNDDFLPLTPYELKLTKLFFKNLNKTVEKYELLATLNENNEMSEGALRVHITKLRKIGLPITTIKGIGYRLAEL